MRKTNSSKDISPVVGLDLIEKFYDRVNQDDFILYKYQNVNGKDLWSCICSAMGWIKVAIEYISEVQNGKRSTKQSMEMYAYISSIDVVWEAIQQLHRVLYNTKDIPFKGEHECFLHKPILEEEDDNTYFKSLRAFFGAHSVNLNVLKDSEKLFASRPGKYFADSDVLLYSNKIGEGHIQVKLHLYELNVFLKKRYDYLNELIDEIDRQYKAFKVEGQNKRIKKVTDICEQLHILKKESKERLDLLYYKCIIDDLLRIYETSITHENNKLMVENYREALLPLVEAVYNALQNIELIELDDCILYDLYNKSLEKVPGISYYLSKLRDHISRCNNTQQFFGEGALKGMFKNCFKMEYSSYEELEVLIFSYMHQK